MRYIGSKSSLIPQLEAAISQRKTNGGYFCDLFSGTGAVGRHFKHRFPIISNDFLYFSHVLQRASIQLNVEPDFSLLHEAVGAPFEYLNSINPFDFSFSKEPFVAQHFSPFQKGQRKYFREGTALHIDAVRQTIQAWYDSNLIDEGGFNYLLASLIEAVPSVSNIAGTYGAYLKHWDPRTSNSMLLRSIAIQDNKRQNLSFNRNANELVREIEGEVLYVDPPYNGRQYLANYHVLETIAKYDFPALHGKTGMRRDLDKVSDYCKKSKVADAFDDLLANAKFDYLFISYSTEGILDIDELVSLVEKHSIAPKLRVFKFPHRRYSRISDGGNSVVHEIIVSAVR